ncbi:MAG: hypothetical protein DRN66_03730 [Candidatus Nanohalarchaeota archaeon]|nr:MAG: hypothetical protein DRN66_03730 [Candidatus Nanohaloarchaeota archaeon]
MRRNKSINSPFALIIVLLLALIASALILIIPKPPQLLYCLDSQNISDGTQCSPTSFCENGTCHPLYCTSYESTPRYCKTNFIAVCPKCQDGVWQEEPIYCQQGEYCLNGKCIAPYSDTCGDSICTVGEDCFKDCGSISSWDKYTKAISETEGIDQYLESSKYYDYSNPTIRKIIADIEAKYHPTTPYEYMKDATNYLFHTFDYVWGGVSCPETAEEVLQRGTGNCVDFSVILISLMRAKGIPARQIEGCVSHDKWQCQPYALYGRLDMEEIKLRAGNINEQQPLGHSWVEIYTPDEGWKTADPTVGDWISHNCIGYHKISHSINEEKCYIKNYNEVEFCRGY